MFTECLLDGSLVLGDVGSAMNTTNENFHSLAACPLIMDTKRQDA